MSDDVPRAVADDSIRSENGSSQAVVKLIGYDKPFLTALAIAISILSAFYSFEMGRDAQQQIYWAQRTEAFLEQLSAQGVHVPPDLLPHKEDSH